MSDSDNNKGSRQSAAPLNSDNVEAILSRLMLTWQAFILEQPEPKDRLDAKEAKAALDHHYAQKHAAEVLELALEVCKNQPITFNRLERAVKEHFNV